MVAEPRKAVVRGDDHAQLLWGLLFLWLLSARVVAGQNAVYWLDDRYGDSGDAATLPHYRSAEEACVQGYLKRIY